MDNRIRHGLLIAALAAVATPLPAQKPDSLPPGVTPAMVASGKKIFGGAGLCLACHGPNAKGITGPDLTDQTLLHYDGSYEALIKVITEGFDQKASKTGQIMPPKGGSAISDADVKAVAAFVWSLRKTH